MILLPTFNLPPKNKRDENNIEISEFSYILVEYNCARSRFYKYLLNLNWSADNRIITHRPNNFDPHQIAWAEVENVSWQLLNFDTAVPQPSFVDLHWIPMSDEVMISQIGSDISRINVLTGEKMRVREGCGTRYYNYFFINHNCTNIIAERIIPEEIYSDGWFNIVIYKSEIVIMNFDGTGRK